MYEFPVKGQINIYRFVPLDNTYTNTLHFENQEAQLAYFGCRNLDDPTAPTADTIMKLQYTNQTYTRNERQYIRIESDPNMLYDCNYMAYQNRDFGEHWFFAFILSVEYINDYVAEVEFELDVMQSFMWNYALRECFVEREHCLKTEDIPGLNMTAETVPDVPMHYSRVNRTGYFDKFSYVLMTTYNLDDSGTPQSKTVPYTRVLNGMVFSGDYFAVSGNTPADSALGMAVVYYNIESQGALDGIMGCFVFPTSFLPPDRHWHNDVTSKQVLLSRPLDVSGYTPKNKKLLSYPFTYLIVDSGTERKTYKYEYFEQPSGIVFELYGYINGSPMIKAMPQNYGTNYLDVDITVNRETDIMQACVMTGFPIMGTPQSSFDNWFWQNSPNIAWNLVSPLLLQSDVAKKDSGVISGATSGVANIITALNTPATSTLSTGNLADVASGNLDFYFKTVQPTSEGAKIIDTFFSMYGYATNRVKIPNIVNYSTCRPNWNYIKATNCNFHWFNRPKGTSVPQKYMRKIISIFGKGITFWKNPNNVGNYIDDNTGELNDN